MLAVISPAKTLDFETPSEHPTFTQPSHLSQSEQLIKTLRRMSAKSIGELMSISPDLSNLNKSRYKAWQPPFDLSNAKQAVFAFKGDTYAGLDAEQFNQKDLVWAQDHLRILSGLYGVLRPLDLMQAYRLEMGTRLPTKQGKNLYTFWGDRITDRLNLELTAIQSTTLINLASNEYFKSVNSKTLNADIITPAFKDWKNDDYKMIGFFAKKARGKMAAWIIKNRLQDPAELINFNAGGYQYNKKLSTPNTPVFLRKQ